MARGDLTPHPRGLAAATLRWANGIPTDEASGGIYFNRQILSEKAARSFGGNDLSPASLMRRRCTGWGKRALARATCSFGSWRRRLRPLLRQLR